MRVVQYMIGAMPTMKAWLIIFCVMFYPVILHLMIYGLLCVMLLTMQSTSLSVAEIHS